MRFSSIATVAAAVAPIAVSASGKLGFALGVRHADATCKTQDDFNADFAALKTVSYGTSLVRTYSAVDGANQQYICKPLGALLPAAKAAGFQVVIGLWADDDKSFGDDMTEVMNYASQYQETIYAFTVGSEGLYRYNNMKPVHTAGYTANDLLTRINKFKSALSDAKISKKVGTADSWNEYQDGTADPLISGGVELMLVNAFGFWQGQDISNASATYLDDLMQATAHIQEVSGSVDAIEIWTGETGWPSISSEIYESATGGVSNAEEFYKEGVCAALKQDFDVFYFEAFDEPWKPLSTGLNGEQDDETHWGAFDQSRHPVIDLSCDYPY